MHRHTSDMGEISWIREDISQDMLSAGVTWLKEHPDADPRFDDKGPIRGAFVAKNEDARALSGAVLEASRGYAHPASDRHCNIIKRLLWIRDHGWEAYCNKCREITAAPLSYVIEEV